MVAIILVLQEDSLERR